MPGSHRTVAHSLTAGTGLMQIIARSTGLGLTGAMAQHDPQMVVPAGAQALDLPIAGGRVAALRWGRPGARPVLAVHGWLDNAASFDFLAPLLCQAQDLDLVAIDLPGHGFSDWFADGYAPASQAGRLLQVLDALGWPQADLIGHSLGASLVTLLAAALPERVRSLCCLDALGSPAAAAVDTVPRLRRHLLAHFQSAPPAARPIASRQRAIQARQQANGLSREAAQALINRGVRQDGTQAWWRTDPALTLPSAFYLDETQVQAVLAGIGVPACFILASQPHPSVPGAHVHAQRQACLAATASVQTLPGGHHLHMLTPVPVATAVIAHLNATASA